MSQDAQLLVDLVRATAPLSPAQARAILRTSGVVSPESLAVVAARARALADNARVLELAAGTAARTAGVSPAVLSHAVGLSSRTLHERYARHKVRIMTPSRAVPSLVEYDPATGAPRPLVLELQLLTGVLSLIPVDTPRSGWVEDCHHWPVPLITGPAGPILLQRVNPLALRVLVGTDHVNGHKVPDDDARQAIEQIQQICAAVEHTYPVLRVVSATDYFRGQDPASVASGLGLSVGADTDQVAAAAERVQSKAHEELCLLEGTVDYLTAAVSTGSPPSLRPQVSDVALDLSPQLGEPLRDVVRALSPVMDRVPNPLGSGRAYRACAELINAIESEDPRALSRATASLLGLDTADQYDLAGVPGLRPAWEALVQAEEQSKK
ncbi:hypothetical protein ABZ234_07915 [Nocardiopsis sp. NPDC006198]|uniref:hypothetical protein n=1 Tax=Nocardiopsis sp. NPDC006198 TaxID=3154472 RepID=UPI0033B8CAA2